MIEKMIILLGLLAGLNAEAALSELDKSVAAPRGNMLTNPGFEAGKAGWINFGAAGTYTTTTTSANRYEGAVSGSWDSDGSAQTFRSDLFSTHGRAGTNGVASCAFKAASGTATHTINVQDQLGATLATASLGVGTTYQRVSVNFPFGSSTSVRVVVASVASNEPELFIDSCYLGAAQDFNLFQVSQASVVGSAFIAGTANCTPTVTSSSWSDFGTDTDCPGPTIDTNPGPGVIQTTDTNLPQFTVNALPPGTYKVTMQAFPGSGATVEFAYRVSDGTTNSMSTFERRDNAGTSGINAVNVTGYFTYSVSGDRTFKMQCLGDGAANCFLAMNNVARPANLLFFIERFPTSSETAARVDSLPASWNGYHGSNCTYSRSGTSLGDFPADATCDFIEQQNVNFGTVTSQLSGSDKLPGIVFTPRRAGRFLVIANFSGLLTSSGNTSTYELYDGTNSLGNSSFSAPGNEYTPHTLQGIVYASSTSAVTVRIRGVSSAGDVRITGPGSQSTSHIRWTVIALDQSFPAPVLVSPNCSVRLDTGNGYGATGTAIRRYTNSSVVGNCIAYADSSNSGMSFTINTAGVYTVDWSAKRSASAANIGISVNASSLTTTPDALTVANGNLGYKTIVGSSGDFGNISKTKYFNAGDVVRVFANGNVANDSLEIVNIVRVGN
jgi:hypothetical protein